uniref:Uncharacterized protein n=1 Tax=Rhizophora mucronata TaxID=61149 RepID=A0A2P2M467_RHIMU
MWFSLLITSSVLYHKVVGFPLHSLVLPMIRR